MADAVAGRRKTHALRIRDALQIDVVVAVLRPVLHHIVVDVGDGKLGFHRRNLHRLKFEVRHRAGGVLGQGLVDSDRDRLAGFAAAGNIVGFDDLLYNGAFGHNGIPP